LKIYEIPEWQKKESLKRLAEMKEFPSRLIKEDDLFKLLEQDEE
jgi:hypothetical protein